VTLVTDLEYNVPAIGCVSKCTANVVCDRDVKSTDVRKNVHGITEWESLGTSQRMTSRHWHASDSGLLCFSMVVEIDGMGVCVFGAIGREIVRCAWIKFIRSHPITNPSHMGGLPFSILTVSSLPPS